MSDCCGNNPGVGKAEVLPHNTIYKTYNPCEVRLYGRPATDPVKVARVDDVDRRKIDAIIKEHPACRDMSAEKGEELRDLFVTLADYAERKMRADQAELVRFINTNMMVSIQYDNETLSLPITLNLPWLSFGDDGTNYIKSIGIIYGYAYEGHCYKMPKPQIMLLPEVPRNIVDDHCCYDCGYSPALGYAVWQIDKRQRVVALDIRSDDLKTIVLDENMPGNRSPQAYSQSMALAPMRPRE